MALMPAVIVHATHDAHQRTCTELEVVKLWERSVCYYYLNMAVLGLSCSLSRVQLSAYN